MIPSEKSPSARDELLSAFLDGELDAAERAQVEQWLASDVEARKLLADLQRVSQRVQSLPRRTLGASLRAEIMQATAASVSLAPPPAPSRVEGFRRGLVWASLAAAASLVLVFLQRPEEGAGPDVASVSPPKTQEHPPLSASTAPPAREGNAKELRAPADAKAVESSAREVSVQPALNIHAVVAVADGRRSEFVRQMFESNYVHLVDDVGRGDLSSESRRSDMVRGGYRERDASNQSVEFENESQQALSIDTDRFDRIPETERGEHKAHRGGRGKSLTDERAIQDGEGDKSIETYLIEASAENIERLLTNLNLAMPQCRSVRVEPSIDADPTITRFMQQHAGQHPRQLAGNGVIEGVAKSESAPPDQDGVDVDGDRFFQRIRRLQEQLVEGENLDALEGGATQEPRTKNKGAALGENEWGFAVRMPPGSKDVPHAWFQQHSSSLVASQKSPSAEASSGRAARGVGEPVVFSLAIEWETTSPREAPGEASPAPNSGSLEGPVTPDEPVGSEALDGPAP